MEKKGKVTKILLDNWVEERQCQSLGLEVDNYNSDGTLCSKLQRQGHKGILSTDTNVPAESTSTTQTTYTVPVGCGVPTVGTRTQLLTEHVYRSVREEMEKETATNCTDNNDRDYKTSVTRDDYHKDFSSSINPSTMRHSLAEEPATFWRDNTNGVTGVTHIANSDGSSFNKNASFSTPIEHKLYQET